MSKLLGILAGLVLVIAGAFVSTPQADAATYYWANTGITAGSVVVGYCDGTTGTLRAVGSTAKNVCKFKRMYGKHYLVYVAETGTILFNTTHCNDDRWQYFTSLTDTSRHAVVRVQDRNCI